MKLVSFPEKRIALALGDYLSSIGMANHLQREDDGFAVFLDNPADFAQAREELERRTLREVRIAGRLRHPAIVTVHDAGLSSNGVYIAMERLNGRDLREALAAGWADLRDRPAQSLTYGLAVFTLSACVILGLMRAGLPWLIRIVGGSWSCCASGRTGPANWPRRPVSPRQP